MGYFADSIGFFGKYLIFGVYYAGVKKLKYIFIGFYEGTVQKNYLQFIIAFVCNCSTFELFD